MRMPHQQMDMLTGRSGESRAFFMNNSKISTKWYFGSSYFKSILCNFAEISDVHS